MSIDQQITQIINIKSLKVSKDAVSQNEVDQIKEFISTEDPYFWHISCNHRTYPPATQEAINKVEDFLHTTLPPSLRNYLQSTNGSDFFIAPNCWFPNESYARYHLFGTEELWQINHELLLRFRGMLGKDPDFKEIQSLNYLAFCDAEDDNYLAILLEPTKFGTIFFLDHEYLYRPYTIQDADLYYFVASSLEDWLDHLIIYSGWNGFKQFPL